MADFYKGKTINVVVGYGPSGGYDVYTRLLARHMSRHIPGNPAIVVQNMPGAGSLLAANHTANVAPKDGTALGVFGVGGIDEDGTLLDFHLGEVEARQAMHANCRTSVLVADASKFGRNATARGGRLGDVDHFFTDAEAPPDYAALVEACGAKLHVANQVNG